MNNNVGKGLGLCHGAGFEGSQTVGTRIGLQEEVILFHVMDEALFGQRSVSNALNKRVVGVSKPVFLACLEEVGGQWVRVITRWPIRR